MPDVSPTKWHLAHITWFFERFVLQKFVDSYQNYNDDFHFLFNSYYYSVGQMHARPRRGLLSRPTFEEVLAYRAHVDAAMQELLANRDDENQAHLLKQASDSSVFPKHFDEREKAECSEKTSKKER